VLNQAFLQGADISVGWQDATFSLSDMIFHCVSRALQHSCITIEQIDSVVLAAHDLVDGRSLSSMVTAPAAGAYLRDEIRLADDGLAAASLAAARIEAGESEFSIVAAWGRASEGDYCRTSKTAFDPFLLQPFGLNEFDVSAARLSKWISTYGSQHDARSKAAQTRFRRCRHNPRALKIEAQVPRVHFPLMEVEAPRFADVAVALILGRRETAIRVAGIGHATESGSLGDRDLLAMRAIRESAVRAQAVLGQRKVDLYELDGATLSDEALALEALGLAGPGEGFLTYASSPHINPSGGGTRGWCFPANGLVNLAECYLQLAGRAGAIQVRGDPKWALATGCSPMGAQIAHAIVLGAE
jgi:acetyl-CoA acetyltransferase